MKHPLSIAIALVSGFLSSPIQGAELKVLTAGAMKAVVLDLLPEFEQRTGHKVVLDNGTASALAKRIGDGEAFDVAVITPSVIDTLTKSGKIVEGSKIDVAKVGIGIAVKEGAALPDIGTVEALKKTLLAATSVAYIDPKGGGSSGIYFDKLIDRLGIGNEVRSKAKLLQGGYVAELVAKGEAEIAVHQISEIVPVKGVRLVGPLPAEVQNLTIYTAGLGTGARDTGAARAFIETIAGSAAAPVLKSKGMDKP